MWSPGEITSNKHPQEPEGGSPGEITSNNRNRKVDTCSIGDPNSVTVGYGGSCLREITILFHIEFHPIVTDPD